MNKRRWKTSGVPFRGYVLVELALAMVIFALVAAAVYGAYKVTFSMIEISEYQAMLGDKSGFVLSRIADDLESLVLGRQSFFDGEEQVFAGMRRDSLTFLSKAQVVLGKNDLPLGRILISYSAEPDSGSGLLNLYRAETSLMPGVPLGQGAMQKHLLCSGLKELRFSYHESGGKVLTTWKSVAGGTEKNPEAPKIPRMVGVELVFPGKESKDKAQMFRTTVVLAQHNEKQDAENGRVQR